MNRVLSSLKPENVFYYFEELCRIPHGSGNTAAVSRFLTEFAKDRSLSCSCDEKGNVLICRDASAGYETADTVMLQAHMDMVCEKNQGCNHDFTKDPLDLRIDGDMIYAKDTTLGGDDGIGVAMILAVLDDKQLKAPALECLITVDEEVGMLGMDAFDASGLKARTILNLDSENEGIFFTSCAGGSRVQCRIPVEFENVSGTSLKFYVTGLRGGHSGCDIHYYRGNANMIMGRLLSVLDDRFSMSLCALKGGLQDNAIPRESTAQVVFAPEDVSAVSYVVSEFEKTLRNEYRVQDGGLSIRIENQATNKKEGASYKALTEDSLRRVLTLFASLPNGVVKMSADIEGLVQTSLNLGIMELKYSEFVTMHALRSSIASEREELSRRLTRIAAGVLGTTSEDGIYPAWEYKADSRVRGLCHDLYRELYGKEPVICGLHAGLECGILSEKLQGIDCVSMGPDILDIHSPKERLSISSCRRFYEFLTKLLEKLN